MQHPPQQQHLLLHIYCQKCARRKIPALSFHFHPPRRHCTRLFAMDSLNFADHPGSVCSRTGQTDRSELLSSSFVPYLYNHPPLPLVLRLPSRREGRRIQSRGVVTAFPRRNDPSFFPLTPSQHTQLPRTDTRVHSSSRSFLLTLAFSRIAPPSPFSSQSEDQLEWLGVLRVPAIIPRQSLISTPSAISTLPSPTTPVA